MVQKFEDELEGLTRGFPFVLGKAQLVAWLKVLVEEFLGDLATIKAFLDQMGFVIPPVLVPVLDWLIAHYKASQRGIEDVGPVTDRDGMTCEQAFAKQTGDDRCQRIAKTMGTHRLFGRIVERMCLRAYENEFGAQTAIDWNKIVQWVITNGPAIMQFIMTLVALFGG